MRVFVAGASGAIGRPLVDRLVAGGHEVVGTTRDAARARDLREHGAEPVVLDAFDADALRGAIRAAEPEVVVHQLTALPKAPDPKTMGASLALTDRLRRETVPTLLQAAREAGARRAIVQSISFVTRPDGRPVHDEDAPLNLDTPGLESTVETVRELETATLGVEGLEGLVLRYGFAYEGVFRQHMIVKGQNRDTAWFAMLDTDWPRLKAGYERWLDPANFDAAGMQKSKLVT